MTQDTVGQRIADAREKLGRRLGQKLTQQWLTDKVKAGKGTVAKWESGVQEPTGENLIAIAAALEVTPEWLLGLESEPERVTGRMPSGLPALERWLDNESEAAKLRAEAMVWAARAAHAAERAALARARLRVPDATPSEVDASVGGSPAARVRPQRRDQQPPPQTEKKRPA